MKLGGPGAGRPTPRRATPPAYRTPRFRSAAEDATFAARRDRTAQRWMNAAEQYGGKSDIVCRFLNDTVLLALSAPSTPEEVRQEIEARAVAGEKITVAEVERLKREARAAQEAAARRYSRE